MLGVLILFACQEKGGSDALTGDSNDIVMLLTVLGYHLRTVLKNVISSLGYRD